MAAQRRTCAGCGLANKMARVIWAVLAKGEAYRPQLLAPAPRTAQSALPAARPASSPAAPAARSLPPSQFRRDRTSSPAAPAPSRTARRSSGPSPAPRHRPSRPASPERAAENWGTAAHIPASVKNASPDRLKGGRKYQPLSWPVKTVISASSWRSAINASSWSSRWRWSVLIHFGFGWKYGQIRSSRR